MSGIKCIKVNSSRHSIRFWLSVTLFCLFTALCWQQNARAAENQQPAVKAVILKDMTPVSYVDSTTGLAAGFGVDVFNAIAAQLGITVEYQAVGDWKEVEDALKSGRADVCPILTVNDARKAFVDFTSPYQSFGLAINTRDETTDIQKLADLDDRRVGVIRKSQAYELLKDRSSSVKLVEYDSFVSALFDLLSGKIDAYVGPDDIFRALARKSGVDDQISTLSPPLKEFKRAIAFPKTKSQLLQQFQPVIVAFESSPEFQQLYIKWFGKPQPFWTAGRVAAVVFGTILFSIGLALLARYRTLLVMNDKLQQSIVERERAEASLKEIREQQDLILSSTAEAIFGMDLEGHCTFANTSCLRMLGYQAPADMLGRNVHQLIHYSHSDGTPYPEDECLMLRAIHRGDCCHRDDEVFWRSDGSSFSAEYWSYPMVHDGVLLGAVVTFLDVTESKALKEKLAKSEEYLRSVVNYAGDAMYVCDNTGRMLDCNLRACEVLGYSRDELLRMSVDDIDVDMTAETNTRLWETLEPGSVMTIESRHRRRDGSTCPVEIRIGLLGPEHPNIILGVARDITNRKQAEADIRQFNAKLEQRINERTAQLQASNKELESFCYSVSHDLRAPLRAMSSYCSIIEEEYDDKLDPQCHTYLSRISQGAQRMGQLIDDLLQLGRVGRAELHIENLDLTAMGREIVEQLEDAQPHRTVTTTIAEGLTARGDRMLIRLVLQNLLDNAWKFTVKIPEGASVELGSRLEDGTTVYFVRDNGAGFDMAYADKLFAVFQRLHNDESFKGTGVGLATVQRIVERHGGRIWAESEPDKGSTFFFTL